MWVNLCRDVYSKKHEKKRDWLGLGSARCQVMTRKI